MSLWDELNKKAGAEKISVASSWDELNKQAVASQGQTQQALPETSPVKDEDEEEDTGFLGKIGNYGKVALKGGLDTLNWLRQAPNKFVIQPIAEPLSKTKFIKEAAAGLNAIESGEVEGSDSGIEFLAEELLTRTGNPLKGAEAPFELVATKKAILATEEATSNIPLKVIAGIQAIGDNTYQDAMDAWKVAREDQNNPTWKKFLYELQDSGVQSLVGITIAVGTAYSMKRLGLAKLGGAAALTTSSLYYTALSASEQYKERGKVDSIGNIAIDVVGDQILNTMLLGIFKAPAKSVAVATLQGMGVEGGTEVAQSLLKYTNDYANAESEEEKNKVLADAKNYVVSGQMLMEFSVGATVGGVASGVNYKVNGGANTNIDQARNSIASSESVPIDRAIESGDLKVSDVYQTPKGSVKSRIAQIQSNPEAITLYRGQSEDGGGLHFTDDVNWTGNFGEEVVMGTLPADAEIKVLTEADMKTAAELGLTSDQELYEYYFGMGYDALIGTDTRNNKMLDVIVNPAISESFTKTDIASARKLNPKFAKGRIKDISTKLGKLSPELAAEFESKVDAENVSSVAQLQGIANQLIDGYEAGQVEVNPSTQPNKLFNFFKVKKGGSDKPLEFDFDPEAVVQYRNEVSSLEQSAEGRDSQRYNDLADFFVDYSTAFSDRTAYVPSDDGRAPVLEVVTVPFVDGKVAVRYSANTQFNSVNVPYNYGRMYDSKDEATQAALTDIQRWAQEQRQNAADAIQQASYNRILQAALNPEKVVEGTIATMVQKTQKREALNKQKEDRQRQEEESEALGETTLTGTQRTQLAFERSEGQVRVGTRGNGDIVIGTYGMNAITRKTKNGQQDRVSADELPETIKNIKRVYRAGDSGFRTDNMVAIAEMEDGSRRAVILRKNKSGQEEVINFFAIGRDPEVFEENLKKYGAPERSRTSITSLEPTDPNPLDDKGKKSISDDATTDKRRLSNDSKVSKDDPRYQKVVESIKQEGGYISNEEAEKAIWSIFEPNELNLKFVNKLVTDKGNGAWGMYWDNTITLVNHPHWSTPYHEATHAYMGMFLEKGEKKAVYDAIRKADGKEYTDKEAEEALADGFAEYVRETRTFTGKLKEFFARVKQWIQDHFKLEFTPQPVTDLYRKMIRKERPSFSYSISTDAVDVSMAYQDAKDFTIKFLSSPMLQGRPKFSTQYLKDSVRSGKFPINEKEQRFVNEVIDAHFANRKDISPEEFAEKIEQEMLPMQIVETQKWSNYGVSEEQVGDDFAREINRTKTFVVGAGEGIEPFMDYGGRAHGFDKEVSGFMFHFRVADTQEDVDESVFNIIEMQSDPFQKELYTDIENTASMLRGIAEKLGEKDKATVLKIADDVNEPVAIPLAWKAARELQEEGESIPERKQIIKDAKKELKHVLSLIEKMKKRQLKTRLKGIVQSTTPRQILDEYVADPNTKKYKLSQLHGWWGFRVGSFGYESNDVFRTQEQLADIMENGLESESWAEMSDEAKLQRPQDQWEIEPFVSWANNLIAESERVLSEQVAKTEAARANLERLAAGELTQTELNQYASFQKFKGYKNNWYELATRVAINVAARQGYKKVRFPSAFTMTRIESWDSQSLENGTGGYDADEVRRSDVGDRIDVYGEPYTILSIDGTDGSFTGTSEDPDSQGSDSDVRDSEEESIRDDWYSRLGDGMEQDFDVDREGTVGIFLAEIERRIAREEAFKKENKESIAKAEAKIKDIEENGAFIGQHGENHQIRDIDEAFADFNASGNYGATSARLNGKYGGLFAGMTIGEDTTKEQVVDSLLRYEARRLTDNDYSFLGRLILAGSEAEVQERYDRMNSGDIQISIVRLFLDGKTKEEAQERLAEYGKAVGADEVRSMMGSATGDGVLDTFYGVMIKNEGMTNGDFFTESASRAKIPAFIEAQKKAYQTDITRLNDRIIQDDKSIREYEAKKAEVTKWLEAEKVVADQEQWSVIDNEGSGVYGTISRQNAEDYAAKDPARYTVQQTVKIGDLIDGDYKVFSDEIVKNLDPRDPIDEHFIEKKIEDEMADFDPVQWTEDIYRYVYWNENKTWYVAYDSEPDSQYFEPSEYDGTSNQIDEMRESFEKSTDLKAKGNWFGALDSDYQGAAYRYEVDIPRYLRKYRKENVEDENAFGFTWTTYTINPDSDQGQVPLYQQMPVESEGEVRKSKAYSRVLDRLKGATENDANYNQMSIARDTASALAFVKDNPKDASKVALGVLPPPDGITETAISIAVAEQAASENNFELQAEVERSRSLRQTRRGQEIVAEKGRFNENSPAHFIGQVIDARLEHLRSSYPRFNIKKNTRMDASAIIDAETVTMKKKLKKNMEKAELAQQVIDLLTC